MSVWTKRSHRQGYGYASLEQSKPCKPDTLFNIASVSKSFTGAAVGLLVARLRSFPNPSGRRLKPFTSPVFYGGGGGVETYYVLLPRTRRARPRRRAIFGFGSRFFLSSSSSSFFVPELNLGRPCSCLGNSLGAGAVASSWIRWLLDGVLLVPEVGRPLRAKEKPETGLKANDPKGNSGEGSKSEKSKEPKLKSPPQTTPLSAYQGKYWNPGYRNLKVEVKDDKLFIDGTDRSLNFALTFEHVSDQTKYTAHLKMAHSEEDEKIPAEFVFEGDRAVRVGLEFEKLVGDFIWFEFQGGCLAYFMVIP
ncbi:hypothetical protein M426DRAFT_14650 [Hypoxylon sp. CI-4A]|nr:hypothetical protein M426DRAFT_14650 [Hypoxylon sp. CI-4A]